MTDLTEAIRQLKDAKTLRSEAIGIKPKNLICKPKDIGKVKRIIKQ